MNALILAAGYGTRLHSLAIARAKPLLPVGGKPIIERVISRIEGMSSVRRLAVVTNRKFFPQFEAWAARFATRIPVELVDDGTTRNEDRLGALADACLALDRLALEGDLLLAAGDNVFSFSFADLERFFLEKGTDVATAYDPPDLERLRRTGVARLDEDGRILEFWEKPAEPASRWAVPPLYIFRAETLEDLRLHVRDGRPADSPGQFLEALVLRKPVHAFRLEEAPDDIGSPESYAAADRRWSGRS
jgi:glucose-1-phosphate thymidylyltransferase